DGLFERLDRVLGKEAWVHKFPTCSITHLPKIKSDHRPLLLSLFPEVTLSRGRPFRFITHLPKIKSDHRPLLLSLFPEVTLSKGRPFQFLVGWAEHPDFRNFVGDNWKFSRSMSDILAKLTDNLKEWNNSVYGHITTRKRYLIKKLTVTYDEIKDALFDMVPFKALESNDFHALFFQKQVRWDFISASLKVAVIPDYLQNVIMSSISNSTMQVMWNGVPLSKFRPAKGIRFHIITAKKALWVHVVRSKYQMTEDLPNCIARDRSSFLWRSLSKILCVGPLIMHSGASVNLNSDCCLNEMVSEDRSWNLELLWVWFSNDVIQHIMKCAWKLLGPQRVRFFIWTILKQRLLSNVKRAKRGLVDDPSCPICDYELVDTLHIVRDYTTANDENTTIYDEGASWACLFGILAWHLWKNHNLFVFQAKFWWPSDIVKVLKRLFLNSDSAVQLELGNTTSRGVIRNKNGDWVSGYNRYLGKCSIFYVKLWGILEGLKLCQR
ncbi:hypothetical protein Gotri_006107, partial [Gossypium trilobum]|nr:hypothetical protein [Gossypium trilobum]